MENTVTLKIILQNPPAGVGYSLQNGSGNDYEIVQRQQSDGGDLQFEASARVKAGKDGIPVFLGPFVQGPPQQRFIYIGIGTCAGQRGSIFTRRLKIPLYGIEQEIMKALLVGPSKTLETKVNGTAKDGTPTCATVKPFGGWELIN